MAVGADGGYTSANDPRVLVGLGDSPEISKIRAYWPSGLVEEWAGVLPERYAVLREGTGKKVP